MAQLVSSFHFESELVLDALREIDAICHALVKRHGAEFRALERRIEASLENFSNLDFGDEPLGGSRFVLTPPRVLTEIITQARRLGVTGKPS